MCTFEISISDLADRAREPVRGLDDRDAADSDSVIRDPDEYL